MFDGDVGRADEPNAVRVRAEEVLLAPREVLGLELVGELQLREVRGAPDRESRVAVAFGDLKRAPGNAPERCREVLRRGACLVGRLRPDHDALKRLRIL